MEKRIRFDIKVARKDKLKKGELGYNQLKRPQNPFLIGFFVAAGSSISPLRSPAFTFFVGKSAFMLLPGCFLPPSKRGRKG